MSLCLLDSGDINDELRTALSSAPWRKRTSSGGSGSVTSPKSDSLVAAKSHGKRVSFDIPRDDEALEHASNVSTVDTAEADAAATPFDEDATQCLDGSFDQDAKQQLEQWYVQVAIGNIPTNLLVDATMQAMLEQTVSENSLISFKMYQGTKSGSVTAFFASVQDAQYCVTHFNGRRWDRKSMPVIAEIVSMPWAPPAIDPVQAQIAKLLEEAAMHLQMSQIYASNAAFAADVKQPPRSKSSLKTQKMADPCKIPFGARADEDLPFLKAESPAFICMTGDGKHSFGSYSEISTESGESGESENEQSSQCEAEEETTPVH